MLAPEAQRMRKAFHRERSKGVNALVARLANFLRGFDELLGRLKLADQPVQMWVWQLHWCSSRDVWATSSRISAMEIAGRTRTKRKSSVTNRPIVPKKVL